MKFTPRTTAIVLAATTLLSLTAAGHSVSASGGEPVEPPATPSVDADPAADGDPVAPDPAADPPAADDQVEVDPAAAAATAKHLGISVAEANVRLEQQEALGDQGAQIEGSLSGRSGGSYLDANGKLVVTVLDAAGNSTVVRSGARAQRVDDSAARLDNIMRKLDQKAARGGPGSVQGWHVDVPTNTVVVTVTAGANDAKTRAMTNLATSFGASVRIEYADAAQAPQTAEWLVGGNEIVIANGGTCSVGFNTVDGAGRPVVLTAGHCVSQPGTMSRNGYWIGATRTANYPGDDFGTFWNSYPTYWQPSISVSMYNGTYINVRGQWDNPPIGATVCKSGRTTGYTCGTITALNQTVVYKGGFVVSGLVRHNACVEGGDSGGPNISAGSFALGVTSGASTTIAGGLCLSKVGQANVSWYQPIGEALTANGLRLLL